MARNRHSKPKRGWTYGNYVCAYCEKYIGNPDLQDGGLANLTYNREQGYCYKTGGRTSTTTSRSACASFELSREAERFGRETVSLKHRTSLLFKRKRPEGVSFASRPLIANDFSGCHCDFPQWFLSAGRPLLVPKQSPRNDFWCHMRGHFPALYVLRGLARLRAAVSEIRKAPPSVTEYSRFPRAISSLRDSFRAGPLLCRLDSL